MHARNHNDQNRNEDLEQRCRRLMDMLEPVLTAEQQQRVDSLRYLVTHMADYGLWLAELRQVLEEEEVYLPAGIHLELVNTGLMLEVDPTYWSTLRRD
jgi:hypothetical protein